MELLFKKYKKESLNLTIEELNELYYVLGLIELKPEIALLSKEKVVKNILNKVNKLINKIEK